MVFRSHCFQVAMNLSTISSQACQVKNILRECVPMLLISSQSSKTQLSQLCTILGPLHNPGPMSRVLWDVFTDRAPRAGDPYICLPIELLVQVILIYMVSLICSSFVSSVTFSLIELHIHSQIVGLISFLT